MQALKILHVTHGFGAAHGGGIEAYLHMTVAAQRDAGHDVAVLAGSLELRDECGIEAEDVGGIPVWRLFRDDWYFDHYAHAYHPGAAVRIRELLRRERPDVVHVHQWIRLTCNLVEICAELSLPTVVTLHDVYTSCPRAFRVHRDASACARQLGAVACGPCVPAFAGEGEVERQAAVGCFADQYRRELQAAQLVLVAEQVTIDLLARTTGLPADLYTRMDLPYAPRFVGLPRGPASEGPCRIGYWGSLDAHKGVRVLLQAMQRVRGAELWVFGPLPPEPRAGELQDLAAGLPVRFVGAFDARALAGAGLDFGVFPSLCFETFSLALTECFELGLPALVSDLGALASRVGGAGEVVPAGDVAAWGAAMQRLVDAPDQRRQLAAAVPELPPGPAAHAADLQRCYQGAQDSVVRPLEGPPAAERWAGVLLRQRERWAARVRDHDGRRDPE